MLVVKTTSATVNGASASRICPRKRVPSSRRRNPGVNLGSVTARLWRFGIRRGRLGISARCRRGLDREDVRVGLRRHGRGRGLRWRRECLVENRSRRGASCRREREQEGDTEEKSSAPPADLREEIACLAGAEDRVRGARDTAETGRQTAALSRLEQNCRNKNDAVDHQQRQKNRVDHLIRGLT